MGRMRLIQHKKEAYWFYSVVSRLYDTYVNPLFWTTAMRDQVLDLADLDSPGLRVLDVGAGTGFTTEGILARAPHAKVTMLDQSPHQLERSQRRSSLAAVPRLIGDAEALPFPDESFDRWVSAGSIEYWPEPQRAMVEARRVLRPGGVALLIGPLRPEHPLARRLADAWMLFPEEHEYREWMEQAGFTGLRSRILPAPWDAQGYGRFRGQGGLALLSRWPFGEPRDLSALLWRDLPRARLPTVDEQPFPSEEAQAAQRLSSSGHWIVPVETPGGSVTLLAWAATPPVFDGPEDLNGLRNADELALWAGVLDGAFGAAPETFVLLGDAQLDPSDGEGFSRDMAALLTDPRLQDPRPASEGGRTAADPSHSGDPALDTADWDGPGNLRTHYVLPAATLRRAGAGVLWPMPGDPLLGAVEAAGPHRLVWVDLDR